MWKKLCAMLIAFMIISSLTITAFAGNTEGVNDATAPTAVNAAKNSALAKDVLQNENDGANKSSSTSDDKSEQGDTASDDKKSTYGNEEVKGADAEFYAAIRKVLDEGKAVNNEQSILLITKPDEINEKVSIYSKKFGISVKTEFDDVAFSVARLNATTGKYETIEFDGEKSIVLACGTDSKEVSLEYGINNLLLISYRNSEKLQSKVQYNSILVEARKEAVRDKAVSTDKSIKKSTGNSFTTSIEKFELFLDNLLGKGK